jgi:hypothetical protein
MTDAVPKLQLPTLEWLLLDAASCSGATSAPETSQSADRLAAAGAPAAGLQPAAAEVPDQTISAQGADAPDRPSAENSAAAGNDLQDAAAEAATAVKAADAGIAEESSTTLARDASVHTVSSPLVSTYSRDTACRLEPALAAFGACFVPDEPRRHCQVPGDGAATAAAAAAAVSPVVPLLPAKGKLHEPDASSNHQPELPEVIVPTVRIAPGTQLATEGGWHEAHLASDAAAMDAAEHQLAPEFMQPADMPTPPASSEVSVAMHTAATEDLEAADAAAVGPSAHAATPGSNDGDNSAGSNAYASAQAMARAPQQAVHEAADELLLAVAEDRPWGSGGMGSWPTTGGAEISSAASLSEGRSDAASSGEHQVPWCANRRQSTTRTMCESTSCPPAGGGSVVFDYIAAFCRSSPCIKGPRYILGYRWTSISKHFKCRCETSGSSCCQQRSGADCRVARVRHAAPKR